MNIQPDIFSKLMNESASAKKNKMHRFTPILPERAHTHTHVSINQPHLPG